MTRGVPVSGAQLFFSIQTGTSALQRPSITMRRSWCRGRFRPSPIARGGLWSTWNPSTGALKLVQKDSLGVQFGPVVDPILPVNAGSVGLGEIFVFGSNSAAAVTVTSYPSGATLDKLQPGSSPWPQDSAALSGTYVLEADRRPDGERDAHGVALVNLTDGAPDTPIATCAITSLTGAVVDSAPIVFPGGGAVKQYGLKSMVSANTGFVIGARIVRTA